MHGKELSWLLSFPGDWHILRNIQPVLFRAYYDAGLKEISQKCGFKATTLTSLPIGELHTVSLCKLVKQYTQCLLSCIFTMKPTYIHFQARTSSQLILKQSLHVQLEECHKNSIPSHVRGIGIHSHCKHVFGR